MTGYINKSGTAALHGIHRTGRLDDEGLPQLAWYGASVETMTATAIIEAMLEAIDFASLSKTERGAIVGVMTDDVQPFQRLAIRRIVRRYLRGHPS